MTEKPHCHNETGESANTGCVPRRTVLQGMAAMGLLGAAEHTAHTRIAYGAAGTHTLIVLSLRGGFDGLNAVAPVNDPLYQKYRPTLRVMPGQGIQLDQTFALHPALRPLEPLWRAGQFAIVQGVGQTSPSRSHFEAMGELERAAPGSSIRTGWMDRTLGLIGNPQDPLGGIRLGNTTSGAIFNGPSKDVSIRLVRDFYLDGAMTTGELGPWIKTLRAMYAPHLPETVRNPAQAAAGALGTMYDVRSRFPAPGDVGYQGPDVMVQRGYPSLTEDRELAACLFDLARILKSGIGVKVVNIDFGEWDMHANMGKPDAGWQANHFGKLARSISAFANDIGPDHWNNVTMITLSEFGRRVAENGSGGVDHGHGNTAFVFGGRVNGGRMFGRWPGLADLIDGDLRGTTDYRHIVAEILRNRMGVSDLGAALPNFTPAPLGLLRMS